MNILKKTKMTTKSKVFEGVTPIRKGHLPIQGPVIFFTNAHLQCSCSDDPVDIVLDGGRTVDCPMCGEVYSLPEVAYRWPPPRRVKKTK